MPLITIDIPVNTTPSTISMCPAIPDKPPIWQYLPIVVLPAITVHPAIAVPSLTMTLWAICTWLSIMTLRSMIVSSIAPRSIVVLAPIST